MTNIASDIRDFVTEAATGAAQAISNVLPKRKVALITGITGQVRILSNKLSSNCSIEFFLVLGWKLFNRIFTRERL